MEHFAVFSRISSSGFKKLKSFDLLLNGRARIFEDLDGNSVVVRKYERPFYKLYKVLMIEKHTSYF